MSYKETQELFSREVVTEEEVKHEVKRREMAGAISAEYREEGKNWVLITKWPELGKVQ